MKDDDLDTLSDLDLNAIFAKEIVGLTQRTEGLFWSDEANRAYILAGSALHDVRKRMGMPCDSGLMLEFATDANAVLRRLDECACKIDRVCGKEGFPETWRVKVFNGAPSGEGYAEATGFARAGCIALIRAKRNGSGP